MIVKFIPETDEEKQRYAGKGIEEIEHSGVREFMVFGNKIDDEGDFADFHEWHGSYRYLMGSLDYFYELINDNRRNQAQASETPTIPLRIATEPEPMIKRGEVAPNIQQLDLSKLSPEDGAFDDEEAQAAEVEEQDISVEQLEQQADAIRGQNETQDEEIKPHGLKILK